MCFPNRLKFLINAGPMTPKVLDARCSPWLALKNFIYLLCNTVFTYLKFQAGLLLMLKVCCWRMSAFQRFMDVSPLDGLPPGRFAPKTFRHQDGSPSGRFAPWTIRPLDDSPPGRFAHIRWTIRPPNSSTHWKLSCKLYFCGYTTRILKSVSRLTTI